MVYLGMAVVGTFHQLVSWFGDSWESLALLHDLTCWVGLTQGFPQLGVAILLHQSLGLSVLEKKKEKITMCIFHCTIVTQFLIFFYIYFNSKTRTRWRTGVVRNGVIISLVRHIFNRLLRK